jgi:hypothetical protein
MPVFTQSHFIQNVFHTPKFHEKSREIDQTSVRLPLKSRSRNKKEKWGLDILFKKRLNSSISHLPEF